MCSKVHLKGWFNDETYNGFTGMLAVVLVFGSALAGWASDGEKDGGGIFTLTDIPAEYHGMYALLFATYDDSAVIAGAKEIDTENDDILSVAITGGSVDIPLWFVTDRGDRINVDTYADNETLDVVIVIALQERANDFEDEEILIKIEGVTSTKGNATASWHDGEPFDE